jgi:hypothetical protein
MKLMFPPGAKETAPAKTKNVTVSPGPSELSIIVIGVLDGLSPTECAPWMLIVLAGVMLDVIPLVGGTLAAPS